MSRNSDINFETGFLEQVKLGVWFQGVLNLSSVPAIQGCILIISGASMCCKAPCKDTVTTLLFYKCSICLSVSLLSKTEIEGSQVKVANRLLRLDAGTCRKLFGTERGHPCVMLLVLYWPAVCICPARVCPGCWAPAFSAEEELCHSPQRPARPALGAPPQGSSAGLAFAPMRP